MTDTTQIYQLTGEQIVRQIALDAALRQQLHRSTQDNPPAAAELVKDADLIADWLRGA